MTQPKCIRCLALGIKPPGIARQRGLCNWCLQLGPQDNLLRRAKGLLPTFP